MSATPETRAVAATPVGARKALFITLSLCIILVPVAYLWRLSNVDVAEAGADSTHIASFDRRQDTLESRISSATNLSSTSSAPSSQPTSLLSSTAIISKLKNAPRTTSSAAAAAPATTTPQQQSSSNATLLSELVTAVSPCFLKCVGLPPSNHITVTDWNMLCQAVNTTASPSPKNTTPSSTMNTRPVRSNAQTSLASSSHQNYATIVATIAGNLQLNKAGPPLVQSIYQAGVGLLAATPTFDTARDTVLAAAKAEQDVLCSAVTCDSTIASGVAALQAACQVILSNGTSMSPDVIQSLLQMAGVAPASKGIPSSGVNNNGNRSPIGGVGGDAASRGSSGWVESAAMRMSRPGWDVWAGLTVGLLLLV
ncbi:hypothetical protein BJ741DRAFT_603061 [Chytriomyces cf. hyalinus JEL632]|nr:hypothetical protein BJ741DRAFT_603061 [Chytriomyces cf. hyalinus JEL632]